MWNLSPVYRLITLHKYTDTFIIIEKHNYANYFLNICSHARSSLSITICFTWWKLYYLLVSFGFVYILSLFRRFLYTFKTTVHTVYMLVIKFSCDQVGISYEIKLKKKVVYRNNENDFHLEVFNMKYTLISLVLLIHIQLTSHKIMLIWILYWTLTYNLIYNSHRRTYISTTDFHPRLDFDVFFILFLIGIKNLNKMIFDTEKKGYRVKISLKG